MSVNKLFRPAIYLLSLCIVHCALCISSFAQHDRVQNLPKYDKQWIHFGFLLGINYTDFTMKRTGNFINGDTVYRVDNVGQTGFNLGFVTNLHLGEHFDLRFVPDLAFAQRNLDYEIEAKDSSIKAVTKKIESTFLEFPVDLKFKSKRVNNYRAYVLAGFKTTVDMVSQAKVEKQDKELVKLKRSDYGYTVGIGFDFYMEMFKFSPEIKMYHGIPNLLVKDPLPYSKALESLRSKVFLISFTFE